NSCLKAAEKLNDTEGDVKAEGFVVVDRNWHRIKVKSPEYMAAHHFLNNRRITKSNALTLLLHNREAADEMIRTSKTIAVRIKYYDYCLAKLDLEVTRYIGYVRGLYEELEHDRKAVANTIKKDRYASFGFQAIGNELSAEDLIRKVNLKHLGRWIPDFPDQ
ncbi:MAG: hypothetical protein Q4D81_15210, partial [Eubacteriales bacterium]|nr:hypothetical protein [Eubacteriales bacterium]